LEKVDASTLAQRDRMGESYGSCVVWVKKYTLARLIINSNRRAPGYEQAQYPINFL
jgi:hypothetical protein